MTLVTDLTQWTRALDGDERGLEELFDRHHERVFRHALTLVVVPADADEVMASAFFELWRRRTAVHLVDDSVLPWLLVTATNLSRNRSRGLVRYQQLVRRLPRDASTDPAEIAAERIEQREQRRRLLGALRQVSEVDAALITLTVLEGLSTAEAAAAVGINPGAARMRLTRTRGRLRALLTDGPTPRLMPEPST